MKAPLTTITPEISIADAERITLRNGLSLYILSAEEFEILRLSIVFRAGSASQRVPFSASATANLLAEGSERMSAQAISERRVR